jgi:hypothetical protein
LVTFLVSAWYTFHIGEFSYVLGVFTTFLGISQPTIYGDGSKYHFQPSHLSIVTPCAVVSRMSICRWTFVDSHVFPISPISCIAFTSNPSTIPGARLARCQRTILYHFPSWLHLMRTWIPYHFGESSQSTTPSTGEYMEHPTHGRGQAKSTPMCHG